MNDSLADVSALTTDQLEDGLRRLAAQLAAGESDFLSLLAEFDRRDGWGGWGMRSASHWLSLHCGMRLGAARERVRVARALPHLPLVRQAFAEGRLSYCKVRALDQGRHARHRAGAGRGRACGHRRPARTGRPAVARHAGRRDVRLQPAPPRPTQTRGDRRLGRLHAARPSRKMPPPWMSQSRRPAAWSSMTTGRPVETPEETSLAEHLTDEPPIARAGADAFLVLAESFLATGAAAPREGRGGRARRRDALPDVTSDAPPRDQATTGSAHRLRRTARAGHRAAPALRRLDPSDGQRQGQSLAPRPVSAARHPSAASRAADPRRLLPVPRLHADQAPHPAPRLVVVSRRSDRSRQSPAHLSRPPSRRPRGRLHDSRRSATVGSPSIAPTARAPRDRTRRSSSAVARRLHSGPRRPAIRPTWAGERLDVDMLVQALAANTINASGRDLIGRSPRGAVRSPARGGPVAAGDASADDRVADRRLILTTAVRTSGARQLPGLRQDARAMLRRRAHPRPAWARSGAHRRCARC